jgi:hypothetical protein
VRVNELIVLSKQRSQLAHHIVTPLFNALLSALPVHIVFVLLFSLFEKTVDEGAIVANATAPDESEVKVPTFVQFVTASLCRSSVCLGELAAHFNGLIPKSSVASLHKILQLVSLCIATKEGQLQRGRRKNGADTHSAALHNCVLNIHAQLSKSLESNETARSLFKRTETLLQVFLSPSHNNNK